MITERDAAFGVRVYRGQERGYEWVGTFKFRDYGGRRGARKAAEQAEAEARFRGSAKQRRTLTIEAYVQCYLDDYRERQKDSADVTASSRLAPFRREFGHLPLEDGAVDRRAASDWARAHRSCVPAVVALFNRAITDEELTRNPFKGLSRKTRGRKDKVPLSDAELDRLCEYALRLHGSYGLMMRALILFAAYSGMRPGELFALRWSDFDLAAMRIHVRRRYYKGRLGPPKNGQERTIVLTPQARAVLDAFPRKGELIFTAKRGGPLTQPLLSGYWTPLSALLGKRADKHGPLRARRLLRAAPPRRLVDAHRARDARAPGRRAAGPHGRRQARARALRPRRPRGVGRDRSLSRRADECRAAAVDGLAGDDRIPDVDDPRRNDVGAQAAAVDHWPKQRTAGQTLQVGARFAQSATNTASRAELELLPDEDVEHDTARDYVATGVGRTELQALFAEGVEDLDFNQGELLAVLLACRKRARAVEVAVAWDAAAGMELDGPVALDALLRVRCG